MARYQQLMVHDDIGWHLMSPTNAREALRVAWMLWRYPDRVACLVGLKQEFVLASLIPEPSPAAPVGGPKRSDQMDEGTV
jgi:hypothetical protein